MASEPSSSSASPPILVLPTSPPAISRGEPPPSSSSNAARWFASPPPRLRSNDFGGAADASSSSISTAPSTSPTLGFRVLAGRRGTGVGGEGAWQPRAPPPTTVADQQPGPLASMGRAAGKAREWSVAEGAGGGWGGSSEAGGATEEESEVGSAFGDEVIETGHVQTHVDQASGRKCVNQYVILHELGRGQHGFVRLGKDQTDGSHWAIKFVPRHPKKRLPSLAASRGNGPGPMEEKLRKEIAILKKLRHPNVVRLREVIDAKDHPKIFLVLEYMEGGEVKWKTDENRPLLTTEQTRRTFRDVVLGLEYLHRQGIIHRDIKPANLLWSADHKTVKISDFGVSHYSRAFHPSQSALDGPDSLAAALDEESLAKTAGSPAFFAPELCYNGDSTPLASATPPGSRSNVEPYFPSMSGSPASSGATSPQPTPPPLIPPSISGRRERPKISNAIDVWALGVTLYCLLFARVPFEAPSEFALFEVIPNEDYEVPPTMGSDEIPTGGRHPGKHTSWEARELGDLLERMLDKNPETRIKLEQIKVHPWVLRGIPNVDEWLLHTDPGNDFVTVTKDEVASAFTVSFSDKVRRTAVKLKQKFLPSSSSSASGSISRSNRSRSRSVIGEFDGDPTSGSSGKGSGAASPGMIISRAGSSGQLNSTAGGGGPTSSRIVSGGSTNSSSAMQSPALSSRQSFYNSTLHPPGASSGGSGGNSPGKQYFQDLQRSTSSASAPGAGAPRHHRFSMPPPSSGTTIVAPPIDRGNTMSPTYSAYFVRRAGDLVSGLLSPSTRKSLELNQIDKHHSHLHPHHDSLATSSSPASVGTSRVRSPLPSSASVTDLRRGLSEASSIGSSAYGPASTSSGGDGSGGGGGRFSPRAGGKLARLFSSRSSRNAARARVAKEQQLAFASESEAARSAESAWYKSSDEGHEGPGGGVTHDGGGGVAHSRYSSETGERHVPPSVVVGDGSINGRIGGGLGIHFRPTTPVERTSTWNTTAASAFGQRRRSSGGSSAAMDAHHLGHLAATAAGGSAGEPSSYSVEGLSPQFGTRTFDEDLDFSDDDDEFGDEVVSIHSGIIRGQSGLPRSTAPFGLNDWHTERNGWRLRATDFPREESGEEEGHDWSDDHHSDGRFDEAISHSPPDTGHRLHHAHTASQPSGTPSTVRQFRPSVNLLQLEETAASHTPSLPMSPSPTGSFPVVTEHNNDNPSNLNSHLTPRASTPHDLPSTSPAPPPPATLQPMFDESHPPRLHLHLTPPILPAIAQVRNRSPLGREISSPFLENGPPASTSASMHNESEKDLPEHHEGAWEVWGDEDDEDEGLELAIGRKKSAVALSRPPSA